MWGDLEAVLVGGVERRGDCVYQKRVRWDVEKGALARLGDWEVGWAEWSWRWDGNGRVRCVGGGKLVGWSGDG